MQKRLLIRTALAAIDESIDILQRENTATEYEYAIKKLCSAYNWLNRLYLSACIQVESI